MPYSISLYEFSAVKYNLLVIVRQVLDQIKIFILIEPNTGKINRHKHFSFFNASNECFRLTNLIVVVLLLPNRWDASMSVLVTLSSSSEDVFKTSSRRLHQDECVRLSLTSSEDVLKTSSRRLGQDQYIRLGYTSSRRLAKTSSRHLQDVFKTSCKDIFKTF